MRRNSVLPNAFLLAVCFASAAFAESPAAIHIKNDAVEYVLGADGKNQHFILRQTGVDYCAQAPKTEFARVKKANKEYPATAVSYKDGVLSARFGEAGVIASVQVKSRDQYFVFEVIEVQGEGVDEFTFIDIPLTTKGEPDEPFAACALALNLQTRVLELPRANSRLRAICYPRFGFVGARVAVFGCEQPELRKVMKEVVARAPDLPRTRVGGPWALDAAQNYGSYLMTGGITEQNVDDWIRLAQQLGMRQIDFHGGHCFRFGDCEPDPKMYPRGWDSFKTVIDKLHAAGILAGLHTYAFFMAKSSKWVTPVPDPRLAKDATFTLADALPAEATTVAVEESTKDVSNVTGFFVRNSVTVQIDDELITYADTSKEPPYVFKNCKRGAWGTRVASHAKGAKVQHLRECFGLFVPDGDTTLLAEVAGKTAEMYSTCGFDMIYLDALDGEDVIAGGQNGWHYGSKFTFEICKRLTKPALMEMSTFHHHLWFVRSRMGAWDHPSRSHKRFIDLHCASNDSCRRMFLPANLGWWSFKTWAGALSEPTYSDDIEYFCGKALANDSSIEIAVNPENLVKTPALPRLASIIKNYEELRLADYFSEDVKQQLRAPGDEFELQQGDDGQWQFRRMQYAKHKVQGLDGWSDSWTVTNKYARQPLQIRIEALLSAGPYDAPTNVTLASFEDTKEFASSAAESGVTAKLDGSTEQVKAGKVSGCLVANNTRQQSVRSWARFSKIFTPPLNLDTQQAMGVWVYGDGKGEVLNLQLKSPPGFIPGDSEHYIVADFTGWRYFQLVEPEGERYANYSWPYGNLYSIYRENIAYSHVHALNLFVNNLPPKSSATCYISPVRALPTVKAKFHNPRVSCGGRTITFPVDMESGRYLELRSASDCKLYGPTGELICKVEPQGDIPFLELGENSVKFSCEPPAGLNPRANVSVITAGDVIRGINPKSKYGKAP